MTEQKNYSKQEAGKDYVMAKEIRLPQLGETMEEGTIVGCMVKLDDEVKKGDVAEGILLLRGGLAAYHAIGAELLMPHHFALLARACEIAGQIDEALTLLDDALRAGSTSIVTVAR